MLVRTRRWPSGFCPTAEMMGPSSCEEEFAVVFEGETDHARDARHRARSPI
jgi:hypothetical protein